MKSAVAIRHVQFEDLGSFEGPLKQAGYEIYYLDAGLHDLSKLAPQAPDLMFVLGAPIGANETDLYPFLNDEYALIRARILADKPLVGICLGAQMIAAAAGARVYPSGTKEIGYTPVQLTAAGQSGPLRHLDGIDVLHWHGDTFDLPVGAAHLAATAICPHQAFSLGDKVLGLQFHPEADSTRIESWLIGHACELAAAKIDVQKLRSDARRQGPALAKAAENMLAEWLKAATA
ncbi:MAG: glutamine amidotransferase [Rhizomicrobium sp.]